MSSPSIEKLYEFYEIVNNSEEKEDNKKEAYKNILEGVSGDEKEKRLASQFISKFFKLYPDLYDVSFNKLLDLCEDDNILIRKQVIQCLPSVGKSVPEFIPKIADTLTQMLVADDNTEIMQIYTALNSLLNMDFKVSIEAIFHQLITQLEEANELINTYAFKYLNEKLGGDTKLDADLETFIETNAKKLLTKLVGKEEYSLVIGILSFLKVNSTLIGRQKLVNEISEQTKLLGTISESDKFKCLIANCKQAIKLLSKNVHADDLLMYLLTNLTGLAKVTVTDDSCSLYELLKCIIDIANRGKNVDTTTTQVSSVNLTGDDGLKCVQSLFTLVLDQLPIMPEEVTEEAIIQLSEDKTKLSLQEALLLAMYFVCKIRPDSIATSGDMLKDFKQKLQFLARVNQATGKKANEAGAKTENVATGTKTDKVASGDHGKTEEKSSFSRVTNNLQILIREFFKTNGTFKTVIVPSWITVVAEVAPTTGATKRQNSENTGGSVPMKTRMVGNNGNSYRRGGNRGGRR